MATGGETQGIKPILPKQPPLSFFMEITNGFSDDQKIGEGKFGSTYKGILKDGGMVAVKRLEPNSSMPPNFSEQVEIIMKRGHENIVSLIASCRETYDKTTEDDGTKKVAEVTETIFCYEYFPKGNLHTIVESSDILWATRFNIVKGMCQGLHYLHSLPINHFNLKPQNILLDAQMMPKITDFELARLFGPKTTQVTKTENLMAFGYVAPEYESGREISHRCDIFSLGLMILEITTRKKINPQEDKVAENYINAVKKHWNKDKIFSEYPELNADEYSQVETCIRVGLDCVKTKQRNRPSSVEKIVQVLSK